MKKPKSIITIIGILLFIGAIIFSGCSGGTTKSDEKEERETSILNDIKTIEITSPIDEETINKSETKVSGTFEYTGEIGIMVNGVLAQVSESQFVANKIPLSVGTNTITATITDTQGNQTEDTITIYTEEIFEPLILSIVPTSGIVPLEVKISATTSIENEITKYEIDFDGDGNIDLTASTIEEIIHTYNAEGLYNANVVVTDTDNNQFTESIAINVYPVPPLDEKWDGIKGSLEKGDVEESLNQFTDQSKEKYREIFNVLGEELPDLAQEMQDGNQIQLIYIKDDVAKYRIRREEVINGQPETITYYIYFARDENGLWKIDKF